MRFRHSPSFVSNSAAIPRHAASATGPALGGSVERQPRRELGVAADSAAKLAAWRSNGASSGSNAAGHSAAVVASSSSTRRSQRALECGAQFLHRPAREVHQPLIAARQQCGQHSGESLGVVVDAAQQRAKMACECHIVAGYCGDRTLGGLAMVLVGLVDDVRGGHAVGQYR